MGCFGLDIIELRQSQLESFTRSCGLRLQLVEIDNESVIECWVPKSITTHKPAVLLIHGFVFNATFEWEKQINALQKAFNLFVPNLLFFGRSTTQVEKRSEFFQAECMMKMLQQLNVKEAHVVGTSYGGIVAFRMAHMYPGVVKKVVIASAGVCMKPSTNDPLLKSFNASHVHEILMPNNVQNLKKCMKLATHKPFLFLPTSIYEDFIKVTD
ncbi:hypothetical protein O6H91_12G081700 [Diphasiastrum complanatum]|uniref:Uncharacterized protein n=1 Tax=Diphasiastrum complanatum TaxID=34168 RepID=A0ACC2C449_DIPCM|nr:hypothetical protein O6H91_12G081700 [Diphasiastrum complanatum]